MSVKGTRKSEDEKVMSLPEVAALLYYARQAGAQPYFFVALMYLLGLRIGEAVLLRYENLGPVGHDGWPLFVGVPTLKRKAPKVGYSELPLAMPVPVLSHPKLVLAAFDRSYRPLKRRRTAWLFPGRDIGSCLSRSQGIEWFHAAKLRAGLREVLTPHSLRHTVSTTLHERVGKMALVSSFLRHTPSTRNVEPGAAAVTSRYVHMRVEAWKPYRGALDLPKIQPLLEAEVF